MNIARAFIDLGFKGFDRVKGMMSQAAADVERGMGPISRLFQAGRDNILDFTRSASPLAFNTFSQSIELLKSRIGHSFTPFIMAASKSIQDLSRYIRDMDPATKQMVAQWVVFGTVAAGAIVVLGQLAAGLTLVGKAAMVLLTNPAVAALVAIGAAAAYAWNELNQLEKATEAAIAKSERLKKGNVSESDIKDSPIGQVLSAERDPAVRKETAKIYLDELNKERQKLRDEQAGMSDLEAGWDKLTGGLTDRINRLSLIDSEQKIAEHFLKAGDFGPEIKKDAEVFGPKAPEMALGGFGGGGGMAVGGMSGAAALGGGDQAYGRIQGMALSQSQLSQLILEEQRKGNAEAAKAAKTQQGILELLGLAAG